MIIYIHGFNSTGNSDKAIQLANKFEDELILSPTLPVYDAIETEKLIDDLIKSNKHDDLMFVGTSLGGFYADYFANKYSTSCVLINPSTDPISTLSKQVGEQINYKTKEVYEVLKEHIEGFRPYYVPSNSNQTLVLLDQGDGVLDYKVALEKYKETADVVVYNGGSHRFDHMELALDKIVNLYYQLII